QTMIYVADGPSDVPVLSVVEANGGRTYAVYRPGSEVEFAQANRLLEQDRIDAFGEADYTEGSHTAMWLTQTARTIARRIVRVREEAPTERVALPTLNAPDIYLARDPPSTNLHPPCGAPCPLAPSPEVSSATARWRFRSGSACLPATFPTIEWRG